MCGKERFISHFRELIKRIKTKPFPIPKHSTSITLTSLDLTLKYYHITLCRISWKLCTVELPWGKFEYQKLPMELCKSPDIFQDKINELFNGLE